MPTPRTRLLWHQARVRSGNKDTPMSMTAGVLHDGVCKPLTMQFRNQGDELLYCDPDEQSKQDLALIEHAARIKVELLDPMSGLESEEPILKPGRLFRIELDQPRETARGAVELGYRQNGAKTPCDLSQARRGLQQVLLVLAYLYAHKGSILFVDEPDAHLFGGNERDFQTWKALPSDASRLVWQAQTQRLQLFDFAEEFFRRFDESPVVFNNIWHKGALRAWRDSV